MTYPGLELSVEVTVKEGDSSTERGNLLESVAKRVLMALQHDHVQTSVRVTGCELDVIAAERQTGVKILVECKAYRDKAISADVLTKMLGNVFVHDYHSAWLITTSTLAKDAKGALSEVQANPVKRQKLRIYGPSELIELLVDIGQIKAPDQLSLPASLHALPTRILLLTDIGEFWAVPAIGKKSGVADTVMVFSAGSGEPITNQPLVQQLASRDSGWRELTWIAGEDQLAAVGALKDDSLKEELDNIAPVPVADDWSDYRPARPEDFVGRDKLLQDILKFFDDARNELIATRLIAIKAPSGWGKSSFLNKLRSTCASSKYREKIFLYAVDCRTASSPRYPELALKRCFDEAIEEKFISATKGSCRISSAAQPFSDPSFQPVLDQLRNDKKVIVLFFDQFEEITTKQELSDLFVQIKMLCAAVESAGENIILGFSWKTDGSIPTDHPAYHVWHSFSDRRREFELPLFSKDDTSKLLSRLSKELKEPIQPWLRRLLAEHSQGYPWLLKKLCVHVFRVLLTQPAQQRELLDRALDVEALFRRDLADLDHKQIACLEQIARESPADHFRIADQFGDATIDALMQRRLVLRNAGKLVLYWDIFRDYVLTKQAPAIPTRYVPVSAPATAQRVLDSLSFKTNVQLATLGRKLSLQNGTLDNIARDLLMMGVCQYDRKKASLKLVHPAPRQSIASAHKFFSTHAFLRALIDHFGAGFRSVPLAAIEPVLSSQFNPEDYEPKTIRVSILRFLAWLQALGIVTIDAERAVGHNQGRSVLTEFDQLRIEKRRHTGKGVFKGEAPPVRVLELLLALQRANYSPKPEDRNSLYVLRSLRLISSTAQPLLLDKAPLGKEEIWLATKVFNQPSISIAREVLMRSPGAGALEVGDAVAKLSTSAISEASKRRYGSGLIVWVHWLDEVVGKLQVLNV